jgi:hypothetical protein
MKIRPCAKCGADYGKGVGRFCSYRCKSQAFRDANPGKSAAYVRKWRSSNLDRARALGRESDMRRRDRKIAACAVWRSQNRARHIANVLDWQRRNPEKVRAYDTKKTNKRRAQKLATRTEADAPAYLAIVKAVKSARRMSCYWCNKPTPKNRRQIDHIIPLAKGGTDTVLNLCLSCLTCNASRKAKLPHEYNGQHVLPFC